MKKMERESICTLVVIVPIIIIICYMVHRNNLKHKEFKDENRTLMRSGIKTCALLLWPVVFGVVVGWHNVTANTLVALGMGWTTFAIIWDLLPFSTEDSMQSTKSVANVIVGVIVAVGTLLAVSNRNGRWQPANGARILLVSLVLCISFVIPSFTKEANKPLSDGIIAVQRCILHYAVGLFICGITVSWVIPKE